LYAHLVTAARRTAAALTYRDFRLLWFGALTSSIGTWMQKVAQAWLIVTLTGTQSAFYLGLDSFMGEVPILLLTLVAGVVADRRDRRHMMLMSQLVQMTVAFILAGLVFFEAIQIWHILTLSCISGCAQAFGGPAYQTLVPTLVGKEHLPNAIALNSIQFNLARIIGPIVAGVALATVRHGDVLRDQRHLVPVRHCRHPGTAQRAGAAGLHGVAGRSDEGRAAPRARLAQPEGPDHDGVHRRVPGPAAPHLPAHHRQGRLPAGRRALHAHDDDVGDWRGVRGAGGGVAGHGTGTWAASCWGC
jgi:hypothetical protein